MEPRPPASELEGSSASRRDPGEGRPPRVGNLTLGGLRLYQISDVLSGGLLCFMVVFSPWAFGTTQRWSIWTMNICGYALGCLLLLKLYVRFRQGYRPARWGEPLAGEESGAAKAAAGKFLTMSLAILTALILAYCLVSALNARATYQPAQGDLIYHQHIPWLPHSYDRVRTWRYFWNYLALAFSFWAARDWLLGCTTTEVRDRRQGADAFRNNGSLPQRLRWLLWLLSINGALLAVEGICQRISGTNKLLWIMPTRLNRAALYQFGPYAYRANGAQYLNLVWPVTLGLWWNLHRAARRRFDRASEHAAKAEREKGGAHGVRRPTDIQRKERRRRGSNGDLMERRGHSARWKHHLLLPCVLVMGAGPIISTSRGGAIVAVVMTFVAGVILMFALRRSHPLARFAVVLFLTAIFAVGAYVGGDQLMDRMGAIDTNYAGREATYDTARSMADEYPLFGVGPGAFDPMFQFYRNSFADAWPAQLHNDWLETRITFGWMGSSFIALAFLAVLARAWKPDGIAVKWPFVLLLWLALGGCLLHARWDFPLQIYSILFLFLLLCAVLFTVASRDGVVGGDRYIQS